MAWYDSVNDFQNSIKGGGSGGAVINTNNDSYIGKAQRWANSRTGLPGPKQGDATTEGNVEDAPINKQFSKDTHSGTGSDAPPSANNGGVTVPTDQPTMSPFANPLDSNGVLKSQYAVNGGRPVELAGRITAGQLDVNGLSANQDALNAMKSRAMSQGPSPWLSMQNQLLGNQETGLRDRAAQQALSSSAQANSALAMRGGLNSGAREHLAMQGARDLNATQQGIGRDMSVNRLNAGIADDQQKMQMLSQIPGQDLNFANQRSDLAKTNITNNLTADQSYINAKMAQDQYNNNMNVQAQQFNANNALQGLGGQNQYNAANFQNQASMYGAAKTAQAIGGAKTGK